MGGMRLAMISGSVVLAISLAGCTMAAGSGTDVAASESSARADAGLPTGVAEPAQTPSPSEVPVDAEPTQDPGVEGDALTLAAATMTAFCRPEMDYRTWINELYPYLSQPAAAAYETVDPANVPCTTLTGPASVRDGDGAYTIRVLVPTDAGEYSVYVHRAADTSPWAVEQITPLASE